jgi:uroporphyrin-III C-methyltransferase/precorrin-2 dehydrogenase/sirohydrochlorin ferrochelatase
MEYLPLYIDITNQPVLVVGAGEIGLRKTRLLLEAGASVTVIGEEVDHGFLTLPKVGLTVVERAFDVADIQGARLVIAATDDEALNDVIFKACEAAGILVNAVDDPAHSRFIFPAIIDRSPIIISISSGGHAPVLARQLREKLEAWIPASVAIAGQFAKEMRQRGQKYMDSDTLRSYLKNSPAYIGEKKSMKFGESNSSAMVFNYTILQDDFSIRKISYMADTSETQLAVPDHLPEVEYNSVPF